MNPQLQHSHFSLGDDKRGPDFFHTQSMAGLPERDLAQAMTKEAGKSSFVSSIAMSGKQRSVPVVSQNKATYQEQNAAAAKADKRFEQFLRANHFDIGHASKAAPDHFKSI